MIHERKFDYLPGLRKTSRNNMTADCKDNHTVGLQKFNPIKLKIEIA